MEKEKREINWRKWIAISVIVILVFMLFFRERLMETKIAKAKMDILETLLSDEPEEAKENIKNILDTLIQTKE